MQVGLRHFDSQALDRLAGALRSGDLSRHARCRGLCERTGWRRVFDMGRAWLENMGGDLPVIFPTKAAKTAASRLLSNPGMSVDPIMRPHHEATEGLASLGGGKGSAGMAAHATLAVTAEGRPLIACALSQSST